MEVRAQPGYLCHALAPLLGYDRRLNGAEADPNLRRRVGNGLYRVRQTGFAGQVAAVGGDFYSREDYLLIALSRQLRGLSAYALWRQRAHAAARVGDYAVRAEVGAAVLYLQPGARVPVVGSGGQVFYRLARERDVDVHGLGALAHRPLHGVDKALPVAAAPDNVCHALGGLGVGLRPAAAHRADRARVLPGQASERLAGLTSALGGDGAGVDDDAVGALATGRRLMPALLQHGLHGLGLVLVDLAAECVYNVFHGIPRLNL